MMGAHTVELATLAVGTAFVIADVRQWYFNGTEGVVAGHTATHTRFATATGQGSVPSQVLVTIADNNK